MKAPQWLSGVIVLAVVVSTTVLVGLGASVGPWAIAILAGALGTSGVSHFAALGVTSMAASGSAARVASTAPPSATPLAAVTAGAGASTASGGG